jgi:DNA-binding MarR family transcriptional regulator
MIDFDIVIEIGYAEEEGHPLTVKHLFLLNISSRSTVRRKLSRLIEQGVLARRKQAKDQRAVVLTVMSPSLKLLAKYGGALMTISSAISR